MSEVTMVSVIITTYNLENYIEETLRSVLQQKVDFHFEILIGDDGSTDATVNILEKMRQNYPDIIQIFQMPREAGVEYNKVERAAANRMQLWQHSKGKYACFLDGDDYYISDNRLQKMVEILEKEENQDCIMCAHNLMMHYENAEDFPLCRAKKERKISFEEYWSLMFLQANALLFRNKPELRNMPKALEANFDDNNITYWLYQHGKMYYLPECMGAYRQVEGSSWNSNDELRKSCSNMIGYSLELLVAPQNAKISEVRHYQDFAYILQHIAELDKEKCGPFYGTAEKYKLQVALEIYNIGRSEEKLNIWQRQISKYKARYQIAKIKRGFKKLFRVY